MFQFGKTPLFVCGVLSHGRRSPSVTLPMPRCDHCDAHVSDDFARVFQDEEGRLLACPNCSANVGIAEVSKDRAPEA